MTQTFFPPRIIGSADFFFKQVKFHISQASFKYYVAKEDLELGFLLYLLSGVTVLLNLLNLVLRTEPRALMYARQAFYQLSYIYPWPNDRFLLHVFNFIQLKKYLS